jgi:hypothetical protein
MAAPRLITGVAIGSDIAGAGPLPAPKSSPPSAAFASSGTTGPMAVTVPLPASEPGNATGTTRFDSRRRKSCSA